MQVSSVYLRVVRLLQPETRRLVYMENNRGLSTEPCGVPVYVLIALDVVHFD